jgi:hypothetical protein
MMDSQAGIRCRIEDRKVQLDPFTKLGIEGEVGLTSG